MIIVRRRHQCTSCALFESTGPALTLPLYRLYQICPGSCPWFLQSAWRGGFLILSLDCIRCHWDKWKTTSWSKQAQIVHMRKLWRVYSIEFPKIICAHNSAVVCVIAPSCTNSPVSISRRGSHLKYHHFFQKLIQDIRSKRCNSSYPGQNDRSF